MIEPTAVVDETTDKESVFEAPPFLRITSERPTADGRTDTVVLELNLPDDETVGEYDPQDPAACKSWFTDLCVQVVRELQRPARSTEYTSFHNALARGGR